MQVRLLSPPPFLFPNRAPNLETLIRNTFTPVEWEDYTPLSQLPPRKPLKEHKEVVVDPKVPIDMWAVTESRLDAPQSLSVRQSVFISGGSCYAHAGSKIATDSRRWVLSSV